MEERRIRATCSSSPSSSRGLGMRLRADDELGITVGAICREP